MNFESNYMLLLLLAIQSPLIALGDENLKYFFDIPF